MFSKNPFVLEGNDVHECFDRKQLWGVLLDMSTLLPSIRHKNASQIYKLNILTAGFAEISDTCSFSFASPTPAGTYTVDWKQTYNGLIKCDSLI